MMIVFTSIENIEFVMIEYLFNDIVHTINNQTVNNVVFLNKDIYESLNRQIAYPFMEDLN